MDAIGLPKPIPTNPGVAQEINAEPIKDEIKRGICSPTNLLIIKPPLDTSLLTIIPGKLSDKQTEINDTSAYFSELSSSKAKAIVPTPTPPLPQTSPLPLSSTSTSPPISTPSPTVQGFFTADLFPGYEESASAETKRKIITDNFYNEYFSDNEELIGSLTRNFCQIKETLLTTIPENQLKIVSQLCTEIERLIALNINGEENNNPYFNAVNAYIERILKLLFETLSGIEPEIDGPLHTIYNTALEKLKTADNIVYFLLEKTKTFENLTETNYFINTYKFADYFDPNSVETSLSEATEAESQPEQPRIYPHDFRELYRKKLEFELNYFQTTLSDLEEYLKTSIPDSNPELNKLMELINQSRSTFPPDLTPLNFLELKNLTAHCNDQTIKIISSLSDLLSNILLPDFIDVQKEKINIYIHMGNLLQKFNSEASVIYYQEALKITDQLLFLFPLSETNLGEIRQKKITITDNIINALSIELKNTVYGNDISLIFYKIANYYYQLGLYSEKIGEIETALDYYTLALSTYSKQISHNNIFIRTRIMEINQRKEKLEGTKTDTNAENALSRAKIIVKQSIARMNGATEDTPEVIPAPVEPSQILKQIQRDGELFIFPDIHASLDLASQMFYAAGLTDEDGSWLTPAQRADRGGNSEPINVVILGDFIDRGLYSHETHEYLKYLKKLAIATGDNLVILAGNHEAEIFRSSCGVNNTPYLADEIRTELKTDILQGTIQLAYYNQKHNILFTHAGLTENYLKTFYGPLVGKPATEISTILNLEFVQSLENPEILTRLLVASTKRGGSAESGSMLWADAEESFAESGVRPYINIFGHSPHAIPIQKRSLICSDTGICPYYGGHMSFLVKTKNPNEPIKWVHSEVDYEDLPEDQDIEISGYDLKENPVNSAWAVLGIPGA